MLAGGTIPVNCVPKAAGAVGRSFGEVLLVDFKPDTSKARGRPVTSPPEACETKRDRKHFDSDLIALTLPRCNDLLAEVVHNFFPISAIFFRSQTRKSIYYVK